MDDIMKKINPPTPILGTVIIRVWNIEGDVESKIDDWSDGLDAVLCGNNPQDNFDNHEVIPKEEGIYKFDVAARGAKDFNGDTTEYWFECLLSNCQASTEYSIIIPEKTNEETLEAIDIMVQKVLETAPNVIANPEVGVKFEMGHLSPDIAEKILKARDAFIADDYDEVWHWLYSIASPNHDKTEPWEDLERIAGRIITT